MGRPQINPEEKRVKQNIYFDPKTKLLANAIARKLGLPAWGYAVDRAIELMAEELGIITLGSE